MTTRLLTSSSSSSTVVSKAVALAVAPVVYASSIAFRLSSWTCGQAAAALQLPVGALVASLQLADSFISDILTFITKKPGPRAQIGSYQRKISGLQQQTQVQQRQILLLQHELDGVKLENSQLQIKNSELSDRVKALQVQLSKQNVAAASALAGSRCDNKAAATQQQVVGQYHPSRHQAASPTVTYDAKGWYLHACVLLAALAVRWWLFHQADPLQRKVMLVIIWPIAWMYGAMVFDCLPRSSTLRAAVACCCWALLGYVANEMVTCSVRERQQLVCHSRP